MRSPGWDHCPVHAGTIPDEPGALMAFLHIFADHNVNVEEIRHQRSGTDCIVLDRIHDELVVPTFCKDVADPQPRSPL